MLWALVTLIAAPRKGGEVASSFSCQERRMLRQPAGAKPPRATTSVVQSRPRRPRNCWPRRPSTANHPVGDATPGPFNRNLPPWPPIPISCRPRTAGRLRTETALLCALFGALYFTQGVSEPTEGLVVQPTRWLLKSWGETNEQITSFAAWITLPWLFKPLYGLIADFLPLGRNRRKNYLILTTAVACLGFLGLYFYPPGPKAESWLFWALFVPTVAVAFTDVVVDALMIAVGQPRGITGHLQAIQWTAIWAATILNGELGGQFSNALAVRRSVSVVRPPRPAWPG